jgi:hypothetical protein
MITLQAGAVNTRSWARRLPAILAAMQWQSHLTTTPDTSGVRLPRS